MEIVKTLHVNFCPFGTGVPARNVTVKTPSVTFGDSDVDDFMNHK